MADKNKTSALGQEKYGKQYLRRAALSAWRAGYLWAVMEGIAMRDEQCTMHNAQCAMREKNIEYTLWIADYIFCMQEGLFLEKVKHIPMSTTYKISDFHPVKHIYTDLPAVFTTDDLKTLQEKYGSKRDSTKILSDWRRSNKITDIEKNKYQKI